MKNADKLGDRAGGLLDDAEKALAALEPQKADEALREAKRLLSDPDMEYSAEKEMFTGRHAELLAQLPAVRETRKQRDIDDAVRAERAEIGPSLQAVKDAEETLGKPAVDEKLLDAARDAVKTLEKALKGDVDRRSLASRDPSFGGYLKRAATEVEKARGEIARGEKKLKFLAGPVALKAKAAAAVKVSRKEKDLETRRGLLEGAVADQAACLKTGLDFIPGGFASEKIVADGLPMTVEAFLETCKAAQKATETVLGMLPKAKPKPPEKKGKKK